MEKELYEEMLGILACALNEEYSYVFVDDDYILPVDSGSSEEKIIRLFEKIKKQAWINIRDEIYNKYIEPKYERKRG